MMEVTVTDEDIKAAEFHEGEYNQCPISQALIRLGFSEIDTDEDRILVTRPGSPSQRLFAETPRVAELFISSFDASEPVKPITFALEFRPATPDDERKRAVGLPQELLDDIDFADLDDSEDDMDDLSEA